ncbi:SsrA-binding protein SmpB [Candidatus Aerophobetes bacterium]|nr:SsrA-binding protein SmpB [Candidatus Aerophobetes bacterium]
MKRYINKKAEYEYKILERWEAGISLKGIEVKSIREGKINFTNSFIRIKREEVFLCNFHISPYSKGNKSDYEPKRERKLLLHRKEIKSLIGKLTQRGLTLIPLSIYCKKGKIKIEIGLAKGRRLFDKRRKLREKSAEEETKRVLKLFNK